MHRSIALLSLAVLAPLASAGPALADHGSDDGGGGGHGGDRPEVRVAGTCGGGASSKLKVKSDDGGIEVEVEVQHVRSGSRWQVVVVQEGRIALRATTRASATGAVHLERRIGDLAGADTISFRASGPGGVSCRATATLPGS
jgi:hypothetical protein